MVKRWVWAIRERESECCGQKIAYFLDKEQGVRLSVPKIYEILKEKYVIRSKWKKNRRRGPVPRARGPRQVVQMDTVMFGGLFAFTGIDIYSREADIMMAPALTAAYGRAFLEQAMHRRFDGGVELIQTDGGSEFKEAFAERVLAYFNDTGWLGPTRRMSKPTSRASTAQCAKSASVGLATAPETFPTVRDWSSSS